ncbi:hypothetical protein FB446DRAFT_490324 [Lentinula raphanica]|nr:hypothetical protein FB446DRAFT_490324 [Lentinula raphanica]
MDSLKALPLFPSAFTQQPVCLAFAVMVHKSQGLIIQDAKIGLGLKEFCAGLTFVALSRVQDLEGFVVDQVDFSRVKKLCGLAFSERTADFICCYGVAP